MNLFHKIYYTNLRRQVIKNNDFFALYYTLMKYLELSSEQYNDFLVVRLIFTFSINKEDSVLKESILTEPKLSLRREFYQKKINNKLKIN